MKTFWKSKYSRLGICILLVLTFFTVLVPFLPFYDPVTQNADLRNAGSSLMHLFGTDKFGRDIFSRVWYGAGISMKVGILASLISSIVGLLYGGIAGYAGKKTDMIMMQAADIVDSIPSLLYVILFMLLFGASVKTVILGICISGWTRMARVVKRNGQTLSSVRLNYHQSAGSVRCFLASEPPPAKPVLTFL